MVLHCLIFGDDPSLYQSDHPFCFQIANSARIPIEERLQGLTALWHTQDSVAHQVINAAMVQPAYV